MRNFITILIALVSISMMSCSSNEEMFDYGMSQKANTEASAETKGTSNFTDSAYVRIGMYDCIEGYDMKVENMWFETAEGYCPAFGQNITTAEVLPTSKRHAIYDQEGGRYNSVVPTFEGQDITVHFDVVLTGSNGVGGRINLTNVAYTITSDRTAWDEACTYDYVIALTPEVLNLNPIAFSASVEDWQENSADVNI